jgi:hypothetical protein
MNMMTTDLISPAQLEHANALLGVWLGDRTNCHLEDAVSAVQHADRDEQALHGRATPRLISTLLTLRGFHQEGDAWRRGYTRAGAGNFASRISAEKRSADRVAGLAWARNWRQRMKSHFDAIYSSPGEPSQ